MYCIVLYCIVLYCIVLYCIVLYCIVSYCIVLYCIVLYDREPMNGVLSRVCTEVWEVDLSIEIESIANYRETK